MCVKRTSEVLGLLLSLHWLGLNAFASAASTVPAVAPAEIPVTFTLSQATRASVVLDDADGHRVANLTSDTAYTAGRHTLLWNGLRPDGTPAAPGAYQVRALLHQPISLRLSLIHI